MPTIHPQTHDIPMDLVVTELGVRIDPSTQVVHVDGERVQLDDSKVYLAFNKPLGVVSITERRAGALSTGVEVCFAHFADAYWSAGRTPFVVVTAGDLRFNIGGVKKAYSPMYVDGDCLYSLETWAASTTASTVQPLSSRPRPPR